MNGARDVRFHAGTLRLPDGTLGLLRDLIHERTGSFFDNGRGEMLLDKLAPLLIERGFDSFLDYYYLLKYDGAETEWRRVTDAISVQETYFWREMAQIRALVDVLIPEHFARRPHEPLRIWSVPCATGEEPITLAIAIHEAGWFRRGPIELQASDVSTGALARAARGVYRDRSFRSLPDPLRERYFSRIEGGWRVSAEIQSRITWTNVNLVVKSQTAPLASSRIIFCRNVFIYFAEATVRRTVGVFAESMPNPGYLAVGSAESLLRSTNDFEFQEIGGAFFYVKS